MPHDPELQARVGSALREYGSAFGALGRLFAQRLHLHTSDATALVHVIEAEERGAPLSASRLAAQIGLSPAATSSLLNRMEDAGHVERVRGGADRRVVTLRASAAVHRSVADFFDPLGERLDALMADQPAEFLERLDGFLHEVVRALDEHGGAAPVPPSADAVSARRAPRRHAPRRRAP